MGVSSVSSANCLRPFRTIMKSASAAENNTKATAVPRMIAVVANTERRSNRASTTRASASKCSETVRSQPIMLPRLVDVAVRVVIVDGTREVETQCESGVRGSSFGSATLRFRQGESQLELVVIGDVETALALGERGMSA